MNRENESQSSNEVECHAPSMLTQRPFYVEWLDLNKSTNECLYIVGMDEFDTAEQVREAKAKLKPGYGLRVWQRFDLTD